MPTQSGGSPRSLQQQRKRAKELLHAVCAGEAEAIARMRALNLEPATCTLADAQLVVAREGGFDSWPKLVKALEPAEMESFKRALTKGDAVRVRRLLRGSSRLRGKVNDPLFDFGRRAVNAAAGHVEVIAVLQEFGADINLRSAWGAGPFGVLDECPENVARALVARGATLTAHAAARFGWVGELRQMIEQHPAVVHQKGGDGQRPLHFSKTPEVVDLLLNHGAEIDARCVDHESTAAQYALKERPAVTQRLLERGATPDIFMAARLGDVELARRLILENPACLVARTQRKGYALVARSGIYNWVVGPQVSPHECAMHFDHPDVYAVLMQSSTPGVRLTVAMMRGDKATAREALRDDPILPQSLPAEDHALLFHAAFNNLPGAFALMLRLGIAPDARGDDESTALHAAAWRGNLEMIDALLQRGAAVNPVESTFGSTPLGWAAHGSVHCRQPGADYVKAVERLVAAGADVHAPGNKFGCSMAKIALGNQEVEAALRRLGAS